MEDVQVSDKCIVLEFSPAKNQRPVEDQSKQCGDEPTVLKLQQFCEVLTATSN